MFFQNWGLIVACIIFTLQWARGIQLDERESVAVLALIYYIFVSAGSYTYFALITYQMLLAVLIKMATIFSLEEYVEKRDVSVAKENAHVTVQGASFTWGFSQKGGDANAKEDSEFMPVLKGIDIEMKPGDFMVVVGQVGCGKTSLLYSIMQETILQEGTVSVAGSISYVEQEPFIYSGTLKENVLFGLPYDADRFNQTMQQAQLERDLTILA